MKKLKVMTIVGTRPEIIRLSSVINALEASQSIEHVLVHTGQNYDYELNEVFFNDFNIKKPDYFLDAAGKNANETIGKILAFVGLDESLVLSMIKNDAEFEVQHLLDGNRVRKNHRIKFRADEEWKIKLPRIYKILCTIMARPLYFL